MKRLIIAVREREEYPIDEKMIIRKEYSDSNISINLEGEDKYSNISINFTIDKINNYHMLTDFMLLTAKSYLNSSEFNLHKMKLMNDDKYNKCSVYSDLNVKNTSIKYIHGPIFNIFNIIELMILKKIRNKKPINSLDILRDLINFQDKDLLQIIPVSNYYAAYNIGTLKNQLYRDKKYFVDISKAHGNLNGFIKKFNRYFNNFHIDLFNSYLNKYELIHKKKKYNTNLSILKNLNKIIIDKIKKGGV